ncbi:MAG TPA: thioredoxin domain-containing protein [Pirellulales bacterium]|nr:thioredoxin domain-containing protein [Pirellulales bacterium]
MPGGQLFRAPSVLLLLAALFCIPQRASAAEKPAAKRRANRLAQETSPYLLLHAHNPVDWYPWGDEALAKAKAEGKLIFLSIGYSSCYWCHVMERESFTDDEIARYLNEHFVCIKVDREERPDIDEIYMTAVQILNRRGGWPLSMFLTPRAKPFFGGTYFPPRDKEVEVPEGRDGTPAETRRVTGFLTLLKLIAERWKEKPGELSDAGDQLAAAVKRSLGGRAPIHAEPPGDELFDALLGELADRYDERFGGFGFSDSDPRRPKFPEPPNLVFLIDRVRRADTPSAREMLVGTLEKMAAGGIRDHLGGGFHRYSTDRYWRIPHFEKMLYDNAQLAGVYAQAHQLTGRADFRRVVEEILAFVQREMTDAEGGFYAALDAETDAEEGAYYVWKREELSQVLGKDDFDFFADVYGVSDGPNFDQRSVLLLAHPLAESAAKRKLSEDELQQRLAPLREKLLAVRDRRERPLTDVKILTGWNGLMIRGYADAGRLFERPEYIAAAARAADFALARLRTPRGRLLHTFTSGEAKLNAYLDDYAFFIDGLIALHQATGERRWLDTADELTAVQLELFWDDQAGGSFFTSSDHEELLARGKDPIDTVLPSGNAVMASNLAYLGHALKKDEYLDRARETVIAFAAMLSQTPISMPRMAVSWAAVREAEAAESKREAEAAESK